MNKYLLCGALALSAGAAVAVDVTETFDNAMLHTTSWVGWEFNEQAGTYYNSDAAWFFAGATSGLGNGLMTGDYLESGDIDNSQTSIVTATFEMDAAGGTVSLDWYGDAEVGYDYVTVYLDSFLHTFYDAFGAGTDTIAVGAGVHTIEWEFYKDSSLSSGSDAYGIDNVEFLGLVPAPGSIALLGFGGLAMARRRR